MTIWKWIATGSMLALFFSGTALAGGDYDKDRGYEDEAVIPDSEPAEDMPEAVIPEALSVTGEVKDVNAEAGMLTLETDEGIMLSLQADPEQLQAEVLEEGDRVTAQYQMVGAQRQIIELQPAEEPAEPAPGDEPFAPEPGAEPGQPEQPGLE